MFLLVCFVYKSLAGGAGVLQQVDRRGRLPSLPNTKHLYTHNNTHSNLLGNK